MTDKSKVSDEDKTITSIQRQFRGGEHRLAGQRASELIYSGGKPNQKLMDRVFSEIPGIERYVSEGGAVDFVEDQGGNPLARQPENVNQGAGASNVSSDEGVSEQDAIDKTLEKGRKNRVKKAGAKPSSDVSKASTDENATKLNPDGSTEEPADKQ